MSKTFKSSTSSRQLDVTKFGNGDLLLELYPDDNVKPKISAIAIAASVAPALCLAILEAAGHVDSSKGGHITRVSNAMYLLQEHIELEAVTAAAEANRVALEAEAFILFKASGAYGSDRLFLKFSDLEDHVQQCWLAVARAARELNKEATNVSE